MMNRFIILFLILWISVLCNSSFRKLEDDDDKECVHGYLVDDACECEEGYFGELCEIECPERNYDEIHGITVCNGNGKCILDPDDNTKAICECDTKYFDLPACAGKCPGTFMNKNILIQCSSHGSCIDGKCECDKGFYGEDCKGTCPGLIMEGNEIQECNGNGVCDPKSLTCKCNEGEYNPVTCGSKCESTTSCNRRGLCNELGTCDCIEGWSGPDCSSECTRETCNNHGECIDGICLCDKNYDGDYCENHGATLTGIIVLLVVLNLLTSYCWYKQSHKTVFERKIPDQFNPEQLAARRQREMEQSQSLTRNTSATPTLPSAVATINKPSEQWVCPACTFNNPGSATVCIVCNTQKGAVVEKKVDDLMGSDEEEVSIKRTKKSTSRSSRAARKGQSGRREMKKKEEKKEEKKDEVKVEVKEEKKEEKKEEEKKDEVKVEVKEEKKEEKKEEEKKEEVKVEEEKEEVKEEEKEEVKEEKKDEEKKEEEKKEEVKQEVKQEKAEIPEDLELLPLDSEDQETELFKNENLRICMILKRFDENPHLFNILYRYYSLNDPLTSVELNTGAPKYITVKSYPISTSTIEKEQHASQQVVLLLNEEKPLKIRITGSITVNDEKVSINTGGFSLM